MDPARYKQVEELYNAASDCDPSQRAALLAQADTEVRREVESLLDQQSGPGLLRHSAWDEALSVEGATGTAFAPGTVLAGRFYILREVGHGGMGVVYEALDEKLNRKVALKCAKAGHGHRLPPEARAAREVSHFNVCKVHDVHSIQTSDGEVDVLSMEFVDGETLSARIRREGPLAPEIARDIAMQLCAGLGQAHRQGVIHRDLKGGNVILAKLPDGGVRAVITDFGLATLTAEEGRESGGTPDYMAPELFLRDGATIASDLYALGVLFHVMLAGRAPERIGAIPVPASEQSWRAGTEEATRTLQHHIEDAAWRRKVADLPSPWSKIVARCLEPQPRNRFASAEEIAQALKPRRLGLKIGTGIAAAALVAVGYWQWPGEVVGPPIRLAVLPIEGAAQDVGSEIARRLTGVRRNFTVLEPSGEVNTPESAKATLHATHALSTQMRPSGAMAVSLIDLESGREIRHISGTYPAERPELLTKALVAMVTEGFRLRPVNPPEVLTGAAGEAYAEGIRVLRESSDNAAKSLSYFEKAVDLAPESAIAYAAMAEAQIGRFDREKGNWLEQAQASVEKGRSLNADSSKVLLASGALLRRSGQHEEATRDLTRAAELDPKDSVAWRRLAQNYQDTNRGDEAIAAFQKAVEVEPESAVNYLDFGDFYLSRFDFSRAEEQFRKATLLAPQFVSGHMNLGLALMQQGKYADAERSLLTALRLRESPGLLLNLGALYYSEERYDEAAKYFERSISAGTPTFIRFSDLGDAYRHLGRGADAKVAYKKAMNLVQEDLTRNPRSSSSRAVLGLLAAFLGDASRAEFELSQALAADAENATVTREAAIAYEALSQRKKTLALLKRAPRPVLEELNRQPDVKGLREDSEFQALLRERSAR